MKLIPARKQKALWMLLSSALPTALMAGQTPVFDSDLPGGTGDWETHERNLVTECEITTGPYQGFYRLDDPDLKTRLPKGFVVSGSTCGCGHERTDPGVECVNTKIRWLWDGGSTPWFDRDLPSGRGDYESIELQLDMECFFGTDIFQFSDTLPIGYHCVPIKGAWCENSKTQPINSCKNKPVRVRYSW